MNDTPGEAVNQPHESGEGLEVIEREWLNGMLQRQHIEGDPPDAKSPGWIDAGPEALAQLIPRAEAHLESGGQLGRDELVELERFLHIVHGFMGMQIEGGQITDEDTIRAQQSEMNHVADFQRRVRILRRASS